MQLVPILEDQPEMRYTAAASSTVPADCPSGHLPSIAAGGGFVLLVPRR